MKYVPKVVTRKIGITVAKTKMHSPTLLFVAGVSGVVVAGVLACKATLKVEDVLEQHEKTKLNLLRSSEGMSDSVENHLKLRTAGQLVKLYGPSVVVGAISIGCLTKSHRMLTDRNTQLTAAYVGLQKFLEGYRGRVQQEIGEEKERDVYYASTPVELVEDTPNGPKKVFGSAPGASSPYAQIFDDKNMNWNDAASYNEHYIRIAERNLTDKLRVQGSLMLNEVYDRLDLPRTPTGAVCGWVIEHPDSDDFVEIKVLPLHDFHGSLMLDFNVAGDVHHMLRGRASGRGR